MPTSRISEAADYRRKLIEAFPPAPFHGLISTHDECDDGIYLRRELAGKQWDELVPEILFHGSNSLSLLKPKALVAFLPAWLLRSMETSDQENPIVLEFTIYFLCPGDEDDGWDAKRIDSAAGLFSPMQREAVGDFLQFVVSQNYEGYWGLRAEFGLRCWRSVLLESGFSLPAEG